MNYLQAVKRPFTDFKKLLIGVLLSILPIINFFALGYLLECAKSAHKKEFELPLWKNWWDLFSQGFLASLISIIYALPLIAYYVIVNALFTLQAVTGNGFMSLVGQSIFAIIIGLALLIATLYILPAALLAFLFEESFTAAFKLKNIISIAKTYTKPWLVSAGLYTLLLIAFVSLFAIDPLSARIAMAILSFVVGVMIFTILGESYDR